MNAQRQHKAFMTLDGREVNGYTVQILEADDWGVKGQLTKPSRTPIPFEVEAAEHQFEVTAVLNDMRLDLTNLTQDAEHGPKGEHAARFSY